MALIDIILLILLGLSAIKGLNNGFVRQTLGLILTVAVIVVSVLACTSVGGWLMPVFGPNVQAGFVEKMTAYDGSLDESAKIFTVVKDWSGGDNGAVAAALGLPSFVGSLLTKEIQAVGTGKLIDTLPEVCTRWSLNIGAFLGLFIILAIISITIQIFLRKVVNKSLGAGVDKLLGMLVSLFKTYCIISIIISVFSSIASVQLFSFIGDWFYSMVEHSQTTSTFPVFYYMTHYNFIGNGIMSWIASIL